MKTVRTGFGIRRIEDEDETVLMFQLREMLTSHRAALIQRLVSDLSVYIEYRFQIKAQKKQLEEIRERLFTLKNSSADLSKYQPVVEQVCERPSTHLNNELFYAEINECIGWYLSELQLKLV